MAGIALCTLGSAGLGWLDGVRLGYAADVVAMFFAQRRAAV